MSGLCGYIICWIQWIYGPLSDPSVRVDVLIIKFVIRTRPRLVLFQNARLSTFDTLCCNVVSPTLNISKKAIKIRLDLRYVANVKFIVDVPLRLAHIRLRL